MAKYYAWADINTGECDIETDWLKCEAKTKGKRGMRFKSFKTEKEAEEWLKAGAEYEKKELKSETNNIKQEISLPKDAIYFDGGTGRGYTEMRITDYTGKSLLHEIIEEAAINEFGNLELHGKTNNFAELIGLHFAIELALKKGIKTICGDSQLVIKYWSEGSYSEKLAEETKALIKDTVKLKTRFITHGGELVWISGGINPSDLGFHR